MDYLDLLKKQFNHQIAIREKRPGITQLIVPLYHEDGDMVDIFLENTSNNDKPIRVCDHGMTLMRLSYSFDIDTSNKERILQKILSENGVVEDNGKLFLEAKPESLYPSILQFAQTMAKVSNMELYRREMIESMFFQMLTGFVEEKLADFKPSSRILPLSDRDDLEVDFKFDVTPRPIFLFGVRDNSQARLTTISCLEFQRAKVPFKSCVVHRDFDSLFRKDRMRITSAVDKQFVSYEDFQDNGKSFLEREIA